MSISILASANCFHVLGDHPQTGVAIARTMTTWSEVVDYLWSLDPQLGTDDEITQQYELDSAWQRRVDEQDWLHMQHSQW